MEFLKFRMIRLKTTFTDINAETLYDVLHDPMYRKVKLKLKIINGDTLQIFFRPGTSTC